MDDQELALNFGAISIQDTNNTSQAEHRVSAPSNTEVNSESQSIDGHYGLLGARDALRLYYERHLSIQRVSGEILSLEGCCVNLAIVEAFQQQESDQPYTEKQSVPFNRLESYERVLGTKLGNIIPIEDLFNNRVLQDGEEGVPRKILIQGRAGIGKTTLCKKMVHLFNNNKWNDRFHEVIWIPLRQLKALKSRSIEDLINEKYFASYRNHEKVDLTKEILADIKLNRALFILDGLDEIIHDIQNDKALDSYLRELLQQSNIIVTCRPSGVDRSILPKLDLELETVGFNQDNITDFVNNVLDEEAAKSVLNFIRQTPIVQCLANIPVQLDAICYSWKSLPKDVTTITITNLYQGMLKKLWRKDETQSEGLEICDPQTDNAQEHPKVDQTTAPEMEFLSYIAFHGMETNQIEFDDSTLNNAVSTFNKLNSHERLLPRDIIDKAKQTSFLNPTGSDTHEAWHFLHLTFQEFFAAAWLARHFRVNHTNTPKPLTTLSWEQVNTTIQANKYNPRYEIVWWMLAGQLEGKELETLYEMLSSEPRDLVGVRHAQLLSGFYRESLLNTEEQLVAKIESDIAQIIHLDIAIRGKIFDNGILGAQPFIPEKILVDHCFRTEKEMEYSITAFQHHPFKTPESIQFLTNIPDNPKGKRRLRITRVLESRSALPECAFEYLDTSLKDKDVNVKVLAAQALELQPSIPESVIQSLYNNLQDKDSYVRSSATKTLMKHSVPLPNTTLHTQSQGHRNPYLTSATNEISRNQPFMRSSSNVQHRSSQMKNEKNTKPLAIRPPGNQLASANETTQPLSLKDIDPRVRSLTAQALGNQTNLPSSVIQLLIEALKDSVDFVRSSAVVALGKQKNLPASAIQSIISTLKDDNWNVKSLAATSLGLIEYSSTTFPFLISAIKDKDPFVRSSAIGVLERLPEIPESAIQPILECLEDTDNFVKQLSVRVLGSQPNLPPSAIDSLIVALDDGNPYMKISVAKLLKIQSKFPVSAIPRLVKNLGDKDTNVRISSAETLGKFPTLPSSALQGLVNTLKDAYWSVRSAAVKAISNQHILPPIAIQALVGALGDRDEHVRLLTINAFKGQKVIPSIAIQPLIGLIRDKDQDWKVKSGAAEALGSQETLSNIPINALVDILEYYHPNSREICRLLPQLSTNDIGKVFELHLFPVDCGHGIALYFRDDRLCYFNELGPGESDRLDQDCVDKIKNAIGAVVSRYLIDSQ